jgi:hypothetical protein
MKPYTPDTDKVIADPEELSDMMATIDLKERVTYLMNVVSRIKIDLTRLEDLGQVSVGLGNLKRELKESLSMSQAELRQIYDYYLGVGALQMAAEPGDIPAFPGMSGWGSRKPEDPDMMYLPPMLEAAEASAIRELVKISNELDSLGLIAEADNLDSMILKHASNNVIRFEDHAGKKEQVYVYALLDPDGKMQDMFGSREEALTELMNVTGYTLQEIKL